MTLDHQDQKDLEAPRSPCRDKPLIHTPSDPPQCDACHSLEVSFFDPNCKGCMDILSNPSTPVSKVFAVLRQWTPRTQQILELLVREVLKRGTHVNDRDGLTDMTLLHYASKAAAMGMGDVDEACRMVHLLISHGADPYIRCRWTNMAAIHYATYFNVAPVLKILLDTTQSIDVDSKCSEFEKGSPLHIACTHMCLDSAEVLLQHGANVREKDDLDRIPRECIPDESEGRNVRELHKLLDEAEPKEAPLPMLQYDDIGGRVTLQSLGLDIGQKVIVGGVKSGILRFCGPTEFAPGMWAGIELDEAAGKNDGSVQGISYFQCPAMHGIFAPMSKITKAGILTSTPLKSDRQTSPPKVSPSHKKLDTSHVTAKIDTGLGRSPPKTFPTPDPGGLEEGDRVIVAGQREGVIRFCGETNFAPGWWYGIDLDRQVGKNDGSVNGERYFTCKPGHGVFAPPSRVTKVEDLAESRESLDTLANIDKQRRLSAGSGGLPSIYTTPTRSRQNRPRSSGTLGSLKRTPSNNGELKLQERMSVFCNNELGTVRYIGQTEFAEGTWIGVELRTPKGKNDGSVQGKRYFSCKPNYGLIVRPSKVTVRGINGAKLLGDSHMD